jgi:hypothetical protein
MAPSSISSHVSAIGYVHKVLDIPDPTNSFLAKKLLKGCHSLSKKQDSRLPITVHILCRLVQALEHTEATFTDRILLKAFFLLAFQAFLRIGELATKNNNHEKVLQRSDVSFIYSDHGLAGVSITLKHFKTNTENKPITFEIHSNPHSNFCPVSSLKQYLDHFGHTSGPLFQFISGHPVTYQYITQHLRRTIAFLGLDPNLYKGHSFRIGAATHAASLGYSENYIQKLGRWKSNAIRRYVRISSFKISL